MLDRKQPVVDCSAQELVAALMLQAVGGDALNPEQILRDLYDHPHLWKSF